jgi:hypothetical protein
MVVLRVIFEDLRLLRVIERLSQSVHPTTEVFPPRLTVDEPTNGSISNSGIPWHISASSHLLGQLHIELPCAKKPQLFPVSLKPRYRRAMLEKDGIHTIVSVSKRSL